MKQKGTSKSTYTGKVSIKKEWMVNPRPTSPPQCNPFCIANKYKVFYSKHIYMLGMAELQLSVMTD